MLNIQAKHAESIGAHGIGVLPTLIPRPQTIGEYIKTGEIRKAKFLPHPPTPKPQFATPLENAYNSGPMNEQDISTLSIQNRFQAMS